MQELNPPGVDAAASDRIKGTYDSEVLKIQEEPHASLRAVSSGKEHIMC